MKKLQSIKYDLSKSCVHMLDNHLTNDLRLILNCTLMPLSDVEHDKQLMIVGFFFMRKHKHAPHIHMSQPLHIY